METGKTDYSQEGTIEEAVRAGRAPIQFCESRDPKSGETEMAFFIPPEGIQEGDRMEGDFLSGFRFRSPDGKIRGTAEMHLVPFDIGRKICDRALAALKR